ncbi:MAG: hypothetical protein GY737_02500, partial [Desulfobacteraceae bacterium]|nr:hypothetical protein [Desulfobacteraceae bacterium]
YKAQLKAAVALAERAGLSPDGPYDTVGDAEKLQEAIEGDGFRLNIWKLQGGSPLLQYRGRPNTHSINVVMHENHVDLVLSMPAFFCRNNFCDQCLAPYDNKTRHKCAYTCPNCFGPGGYCKKELAAYRKCPDCLRAFPSDACFQRHTLKPKGGKSVCEQHKLCPDCHYTIRTQFPHHCSEKTTQCTRCDSHYPKGEEHQCYMMPVDEEQLRGPPKHLVYADFESSMRSPTGQRLPAAAVAEHTVCLAV